MIAFTDTPRILHPIDEGTAGGIKGYWGRSMNEEQKKRVEESVCWDEPDREDLRFTDEYEAIESILNDWDGPLEGMLVICGYSRMPISTEFFHPLEDILDNLDEEYGNPYGDPFEPTEKMKEAERVFLEIVQREYTPWACEEVCRKEIDVLTWVKANRPDWLEGSWTKNKTNGWKR